MRILYSFTIYLLTPFLLLYLAVRGLRNRSYLRRWNERLAVGLSGHFTGGIAVHAVSVGEVNAAAPLIRALLNQHPQHALTVTCFTPTGSARLETLFGEAVHHVYLPLDLPGAVQRFFKAIQPSVLIIMETEIWPNLYAGAARLHVPLVLANARISQGALPGYQRLKKLIGPAIRSINWIGAQSETDASRLISLGASPDQLIVSGNLKFDLELPDYVHQQGEALRRGWGEQRPVLVAGSTHEGDEQPLLEALQGVLKQLPDALLVVVPRHPERFEQAAEKARAAGLVVHRFSSGRECPPQAQCLVVDTMGELLPCYAAADIAFVGGSLQNRGGHNVLEPAALGCPVLIGPHTFNFAEITAGLIACGGARQVHNAPELEARLIELWGNPELRQAMGKAGMDLVQAGRGALKRTLAAVDSLIRQR